MSMAGAQRAPLAVFALLGLALLCAGCAGDSALGVRSGAQVLAAAHFSRLAGQRVGVIVNNTSLVGGALLIDRLAQAPDVTLAAIFTPEHGLRGARAAGQSVAGGVDARTGAPIYSLYGKTRAPTAAMLRHLDVLVFDIQDIGARFYTYISTMGLAMQAAARAGIPFMVLDRPNPLGGKTVSGYVLEPAQASFVGLYPVPVVHGMSVGELARLIKGEKLLPGLETLKLTVVPVRGWRRAMRWPDTGFSWHRPSPNIPDFETALVYPGAALFEAATASEGRGTKTPFRLLGAPWADGAALAAALNRQHLPGVRFAAAHFTPRAMPGMAPHPKWQGQTLAGVRISVIDAHAYRPFETGIYVLHAFYHQAQTRHQRFFDRPGWLASLAGTERLGAALARGDTPQTIIASWQAQTARFKSLRRPYLLYR